MKIDGQIKVAVNELRLRNFRAFANARLGLSDLTFLVGRNGSGKSSLLDAVDFLREAVTDSLETALDRRGGILNVRRLTTDNMPDTGMGVAVAITTSFPGGRTGQAVYGFQLCGDGRSPHYTVDERLMFSPGEVMLGFERRDQNFRAQRFKLEVVPPPGNLVLPLVAGSDPLWKRVLDTIRDLLAYELSPGRMAEASDISQRSTLLKDGANAGDALKALQVHASTDHAWIVRRLAAVADGMVDVRAEPLLGRRVLRFVQDQPGGSRDLDASQVSQGTLRALGVLLALRQHPTPSQGLVDEIENSLHPAAIAVLLDAALSSCDRTRVVLTSHSPEVLSHPAVTGERVRVVEWRDGISQIFRLTPETQAAVNEVDTVGWMLQSNALWTGPEAETCPEDLFALESNTELR